eukprot:9020575-Alexandrium_andersonii.AAC.1
MQGSEISTTGSSKETIGGNDRDIYNTADKDTQASNCETRLETEGQTHRQTGKQAGKYGRRVETE